MENDELKRIKKLYGEDMAHLCREMFPTILNTPNLLIGILESNFAPTNSLYDDIKSMELEEEFENFIYSFVEEINNYASVDDNPFELMKKAGYTLYECNSEEDIQSFKKYYRDDEIICTITQKNRLRRCHVFFAIRDDVDEIRREDFVKPERDDRYGTSVISIQFDRGRFNKVSIKNRYNHKVLNPDSTFDNDLEKIIPGLTKSFEKYCGLNIVMQIKDLEFVELLPYIKANNGRYYRFNAQFDNVFYCENNIIIDHGIVWDVYAKSKERYIVMDYYVLDMKLKTIRLHDSFIEDGFIDSIMALGSIKEIKIKREGKTRVITIICEDNKYCEIVVDSKNKIISYVNNYVEEINDKFIYYKSDLMHIELNSVTKIGDNFLVCCPHLDEINLPKVKEIGDGFLRALGNVKKLFIPEAVRMGDYCLADNDQLESIYAPNLEYIGNLFLTRNDSLKRLDLPSLICIGDNSLYHNKSIEEINMPNIKKIGSDVLKNNSNINIDNYNIDGFSK